ncbi:gliding motility-associated C-terminal domain-containing protein, partial [Chitinophagaceae bacterium LWZ2-11]
VQGSPVTAQGWYLDGAAFTASTKMSYADNGKTLTYQTTTGCGISTSNAVTITINDTALVAAIPTPDAICAGNTLSLTAPSITEQGSPITTQGWYLDGAAFTASTKMSYADNGKTLTYQTTTGCGISTSNAVTITINDTALVATIPTPDAICAGNTLSLTTPNVIVQGSPVTAQGWYLDGAAFTASTKMSYADNGKTLTYQTTTGCGTSTSNAVTITINDTALLTKINTPDAICAGNTLSLTTPNVIVQGSPVTAQGWYLDGAAFTASTKMSYADNGKTLTYQTITGCGTSTSNAVTITINDTALLTKISTPAAICAGNTLSLTAPSVTVQGSSVTTQGWYLDGVTFDPLTVLKYTDNGKTLSYKTTTGCGTSTSNAVTITINDTALVAAIPTPAAICAGGTLSLTAPSVTIQGSPVTTQGWYLDGAAFNPATALTYADNGKTLTYQTTSGCGTSTSNAVTITINPMAGTPVITVTPSPDAIITGSNVVMSVTTPQPDETYIWYKNGIQIQTGPGYTINNFKQSDLALYSVQAISALGCLNPISATLDLTKGNRQFITWKTADKQQVGSNEEITYTIHVENIGTSDIDVISISDPIPAYTNYISGSGGILNNGTVTFSDANIKAGDAPRSYSFKVITADDLTGVNVISNIAQVAGDGTMVPTKPADPGNPNQPDPGCTNPEGCPTNIPVIVAKSFDTWKDVSDANGNGVAESNEVLTYTIHIRNTSYLALDKVTVTDKIPAYTTYLPGSGGVYNETDTTVAFTWNNLKVGQDTTVTFQVRVQQETRGISEISNIAEVTGDTTTHSTGCTESMANTGCPTVIPVDGGLKIPNVITPNGDGINDNWWIKGLENFSASEVIIWNRWNNEVFNVRNYENGSWSGAGLNDGTYFYIVKVKNSSGNWEVYKGWVLILRK